ncbi:sensor histidine kinase [Paenibacillus sp. N3.4]|uniref:cache domain-containing sensor histidine kinase n=1 Tax=Paenibacillus sp. N3.4 TaxID=2603222 RepID=UPI0011C8BB1F|nr:sensor histidine kinase [Paenibacillus sp. N3.4]TXK74562.1 sensor histidine kinase [Paenibacillus sp. N3.4]
MMFRNVSFRLKMFILMFIVIIIPIIVVSTLLSIRSEQSITDQTSKVVISSIDFAITNLDTALDNVTGMSKLILTDDKLMDLATKPSSAFQENTLNEKYARILDLLGFFITRIKVQNVMEGIDSFYLYLNKQQTFIDSKSSFYKHIDPSNIDFIAKSKHPEGIDHWFVSEPVDFYTLNHLDTRFDRGKLISFNKLLQDEQGQTIAVLAVNINESYISEYYSKIQRGIPGNFLLLDQEANVVASVDKAMIGKKTELYAEINDRIVNSGKESGSFFIQNKNNFVVYAISNETNWRYVVIIPATEILGKIYESRKFLYMLISITFILIFFISFSLSNLFYKPLLKLVRAMQKIENRNLDVRILDNRKDEYKQVFQGFNDMVSELNILVKDLATEKILKQEAEIKLLQAQINPHFLYNTLDSIYSIARIKKVDEIAQMVAALSNFFRVSLSGGREIVTLKEATTLAVSYLTILNIRYRGGISFQVELPEELENALVPKLLLQPIVENAIYHGIETYRGKGHITIRGTLKEEQLEIIIEDNGSGMDEEMIAHVRFMIASNQSEGTKSFALRNLNRHIQLKYGAQYGLRIDSLIGKGTSVCIQLPYVTGEEQEG